MKNRFRLALAQINTTVGDIEGNEHKIIQQIDQAGKLGVDVVAFPELTVTGYPPEDLLLRPQFVEDNLVSVRRIAKGTRGITAVVGFAHASQGKIYNAAAIVHEGRVTGVHHKIFLPNYGVFDEQRYFVPGDKALVFVLGSVRVGVNICEDIWVEENVADVQALAGDAEIILNISSSPYHAGKARQREAMLSSRARKNRAVVAYVNLVGGQDELVFDGMSFVFNEQGALHAQGDQFREDMIIVDIDVDRIRRGRHTDQRFLRRKRAFGSAIDVNSVVLVSRTRSVSHPRLPVPLKKRLSPLAEVYQALVLGTRDYVKKNGFGKVVIGLSGGIDSALTATVAADALGSENVVGVTMPSPYSSKGSVIDSRQLATNLGIRFMRLPIEEPFAVMKGLLKESFDNLPEDITEENLQARIRGILLMALSNKFGWLVLAPGNKSEISMGYCTLYGDMVGGFAVIKDVPKTLVFKLARHRNRQAGRAVIPLSTITKPPSAELKPNQRDTDSLPPYEILDPILEAYVEQDKSVAEIVAMGFERTLVEKVARAVDRNEYKRRQGPPGIKITPRAFGKDRRVPITNRYTG